jgi:antibiotic biosynthesis monooxygenase (ABM) superfamily enzyme
MESKFNELSEQWWRERAPNVPGAISSTIFKSDNDANEFILIAVFDSKENYEKNSEDPEQDRWYQQLAACFEGEPRWTDGEVVFSKQLR